MLVFNAWFLPALFGAAHPMLIQPVKKPMIPPAFTYETLADGLEMDLDVGFSGWLWSLD